MINKFRSSNEPSNSEHGCKQHLRDVNSLCSSIQTIHENYIVLTRMIRKEKVILSAYYNHYIHSRRTLSLHKKSVHHGRSIISLT